MTKHGNVIVMADVEERVKPVPGPWHEMLAVKQAAGLVGVSGETIRKWCIEYGIGRQIKRKAKWRVSRPALYMVAAADFEALEEFRRGNRGHPLVAPYLDY